VRTDDKRRGRLNCISKILEIVPYKKMPGPKITLPKRSNKNKYDDEESMRGRHFVAEKF